MDAEVVPVYSDNDISAFNGKRRPDFEDLLSDIRGGKVDVLLCQHTDRLYRRLRDLVRLFEAGPTLLIKTLQGADIDLSNATGKMLATSSAACRCRSPSTTASGASPPTSSRRRWAATTATATGRSGTPATASRWSRRPTMFRKAVADLLEGTSLRAIAREWNASGVTTTLGGTTAS